MKTWLPSLSLKPAAWLAGCILFGSVASLLAEEPADYVAHEWGTFTSVQGSDGVQRIWQPLVTSELPKFVHDRRQNFAAVRFLTKDAMTTRQRLETPVIYFYSPQPREVSATVNFPLGQVTEWYPQLTPPATGQAAPAPAAQWAHVHLLAPGAVAPALPQEAGGSHYYAARAVEANRLQVPAQEGTETEQFLFYRGVGSFEAPLTVKAVDARESSLELQNHGSEPLAGLVVYEVQNGSARFAWAPALAPGATGRFAFDEQAKLRPLNTVRAELAGELQAALQKAGLYPAEAAAMIHTWDDSWFAESGLRVLYLLPRPWADRTLPLTLNPAPREVARVMVGRAEIITPPVEWALQQLVERYLVRTAETCPKIVAETKAIPLGRFAGPALDGIMSAPGHSLEFCQAAQALRDAAFPPAKPDHGAAPIAARQ